MSNIRNPQRVIQFFHRSGPMACPYRDKFVERKLFTRLPSDPVLAQSLNSELSKGGFRRSHDVLYRPICEGCSACVPVRIPAKQFSPSKSMRRIWNGSRDLVLSVHSPKAGAEDYSLFRRYQLARHPDSDMARMSESDYRAMIEDGSAGTVLLFLRETGPDTKHQTDQTERHGVSGAGPSSHTAEAATIVRSTSATQTPTPDAPMAAGIRPNSGRLIGVMIADRLDDGYSAVYSFFDAAGYRKGLGTVMIMSLVEQAVADNLDHVYLGYWIAQSRKMAYKSRFQPLQYLTERGWQTV